MPPTTRPGGRRPARICHVDDSPTSAFVTNRLLQDRGHEVEYFALAEPAFVALIQKDFDLLVTDLKVSREGMDGDDLIRALRNSGAAISRMPVIVVTSVADPAEWARAYEAGANVVLSKPLDADQLEASIGRLLFGEVVPIPARSESRVAAPVEAPVVAPVAPGASGDDAIVAPRPAPYRDEPLRVPKSSPPRPRPEPRVEPKIGGAGAGKSTDGGIALSGAAPASNAIHPINLLHELGKHPLSRERDAVSGWISPGAWWERAKAAWDLSGPRIILRTLIVGVVLVAASQMLGLWGNDGTPVTVVAAEQGEIFQSVTVPGRVVSRRSVDVTASMGGRLVEVLVKEGDRVQAGQVLARLDDREAYGEVKRAESGLVDAQEKVAVARRLLERMRQASANGAIARQQVEDAEVELRSAQARERIAAADVRASRLLSDNLRIAAPFAGTITARYAELGQWAGISTVLFSLVDETQREVEVRVDTADSASITSGQPVDLSSDAFPGLTWREYVTRIASAASAQDKTNSVRVYVSLGNDAPPLRFGQQVDAEVRTASNANAIKLPFNAVLNRDGESMVAVIQEGKVKFIPIVTGIADFTHVEVRQGLHVGQQVIKAQGLGLEEGAPVYIKATKP